MVERKSKKRNWKNKNEKEEVIQEKLQQLDQFAGSSAEEDNDDDDSEKEEKKVPMSRSLKTSSQGRVAVRDQRQAVQDGSRSWYGDVSGDEDSEEGEEESEDEEEAESGEGEKPSKRQKETKANKNNSEDDDQQNDDSLSFSSGESNDDDSLGNDEFDYVSDEDEDEGDTMAMGHVTSKAQGMASVMARILDTGLVTKASSSPSADSPAVVLSKTVTKLQKIQSEEREKQTSLSHKRGERKRISLVSMHVPLSLKQDRNNHAVSADVSDRMAQEIQMERVHRRIATRGVVALFNAIAQHQQKNISSDGVPQSSNVDGVAAGSEKKESVTSKRAFLVKIKESAVANSAAIRLQSTNSGAKTTNSNIGTAKKTAGWDALKDNYMMGSNNLKVGTDRGFVRSSLQILHI